MLKAAVLTVYKERLSIDRLRDIVAAFEDGVVAHKGEAIASSQEAELLSTMPTLREPVAQLTKGDESPAAVASAVEFVLEGLHLSKRLNKDASGARSTYRSR